MKEMQNFSKRSKRISSLRFLQVMRRFINSKLIIVQSKMKSKSSAHTTSNRKVLPKNGSLNMTISSRNTINSKLIVIFFKEITITSKIRSLTTKRKWTFTSLNSLNIPRRMRNSDQTMINSLRRMSELTTKRIKPKTKNLLQRLVLMHLLEKLSILESKLKMKRLVSSILSEIEI